MLSESAQAKLKAASDCDVRFDRLTRELFATDASIYQMTPCGVAFPTSPEQAARVLRIASEENISIIPRGAGTGLAGGAVGDGLVVDFSKYNRAITDLNVDARRVRVGSGVVLDRLNAFLEPQGLTFGPDVATSSRATLGGMIGNNSSGARAPIYGTTIDNVESLDIVLADGRIERIGPEDHGPQDIHDAVGRLVESSREAIDEHCPPGLVKRWPGYGLDRWLRDRNDLTRIIGGSEGTLAAVVSAELKLVPLPEKKNLGALFFDSVTDAMAATMDIVDLKPVAIEHIDRVLFDQTKGQLLFRKARALLDLDDAPCEAILLVEFYDDNEGRLQALMDRKLGTRRAAFEDEDEMQTVWSLRKAGLTLLTGCKGDAKPAAGIEDVAVRPEQLPAYVDGLRKLMASLELEGSFYGHAASGLLHVRPVVDLHNKADLAKYRALADDVSALVREFKGSIAAEHGVGMARVEYLPDHVGPELMAAFRKVKEAFDPKGLMNPGKIVPDGRFAIDKNLRQGANNLIELPFRPVIRFRAKDESFVGNLEQCNGCGGCRKDSPTMCPTYLVTNEEVMSTRGRANAIRAALEHRLGEHADGPWGPELDDVLATCLSCKACGTECPSSVNLPLLKAELLHARHATKGVPLRERLLSRVDRLGKAGALMPAISNALIAAAPMRSVLDTILGLSKNRPLPPFAKDSFSRWFQQREKASDAPRGKVVLWDDCFVRHYEPQIGQAAVTVLEAAGFEVTLREGDACCGRPAFSTGRLDLAMELAQSNVSSLDNNADIPIIALEPSCYSMFAEDYIELGVKGAERLSKRVILFEEFIETLLSKEPQALRFNASNPAAIHGHCHTKALRGEQASASVAARAGGGEVHTLETGCCGMAGAFGALSERYDLSVKIAQPLVEQVNALPDDTDVIASGTSCRHQIEHLTGRRALHMAEYLCEALTAESASQP